MKPAIERYMMLIKKSYLQNFGNVSRVIEFLDQLGGEAVEVQESNDGQRVIIFTEAIVERIRTHKQSTGSNAVVTHEEVAR